MNITINYRFLWLLVFVSFGAGSSWTGLSKQPAIAQITPDQTLGPESSRVRPVDNTRALIEGGAIRGHHLFHSFSEFNVGEGQEAYFANPPRINAILSRVTGNDASDIFGTLGVNGTANLFLLNPNGIIFGPNAKLDISGSFVATTANAWNFSDGNVFNAKQPNEPPLLTMNVTPGLQMGVGQSPITNDGQLIAGRDLILNGSALDLEGQLIAGEDLWLGGDRVQIRDSVLTPFVAQAGEALTIEGEAIDIFALNHPNSGLISGGDMVLRSRLATSRSAPSTITPPAIIGDAHYWSGGNFRIETSAGTLAAMTSPNDPVIRATGDVALDSYSGASLHILAGGSVTIPGQIQITDSDATNGIEETVQLSDGTTLNINGLAEPTLDIRAGVAPTAIGAPIRLGALPPVTESNQPTTANIQIGQVSFETSLFSLPLLLSGTVFLTNQYEPNPALTGNIQMDSIVSSGGNVVIDGRNNVRLSNNSVINTSSLRELNISPFLNAAGSIRLIATEELTLENDAKIQNNTIGNNTFSRGITISSGSLQMNERSVISASTFSSQNGGDIDITVQDSITLIGDPEEKRDVNQEERFNTGIASTINPVVPGLASIVNSSTNETTSGNIRIEAGSLTLTNGVTIGTFVKDGQQGNAGNIDIVVREDILLDGRDLNRNLFGAVTGSNGSSVVTGIDAGLGQGSVGEGGDISIRARNLTLNAAGFPAIRADLIGEGPAGNIQIDVDDTLKLKNRSAIISNLRAGATGDAGTITINADRVILQDNSLLSTQTDTNADGPGNRLTIRTNELRLQDGSGISSETSGNDPAGDIILQPSAGQSQLSIWLQDEDSAISAATIAAGNGGNLILTASDAIAIQGPGRLLALTTGAGQAGNIKIETGTLTLSDANFSVESIGNATGAAGDISIAADRVSLSDTNISAEPTNVNAGGNIDLQIGDRLFLDQSTITASTITGVAGDISIQALNSVQLVNESLLSVATQAPENDQTTESSTETENGRLAGGDDGRSLFASDSSNRVESEDNSVPEAGTLSITTNLLSIEGNSQIEVSSLTGQAGNVNIVTPRLLLEAGAISAATAFSPTSGEDSANVNISGLELLQMNGGSLISADARNQANGGNISINASGGFITASPNGNNDLIATAVGGTGGSLDISTQLLSGFRENAGTVESLQANQSNDMSVTSTLGTDGVIVVNDLGIDPVQAAADLPVETAPPLLSQGCTPGGGRGNFVNEGQGGIPLGPGDVRGSDRAWEDIAPSDRTTQALIEAQTWTVDTRGTIVLHSEPEDKVSLFTCD